MPGGSRWPKREAALLNSELLNPSRTCVGSHSTGRSGSSVPAGRPAGTHTAEAAGAGGPSDAAKCSPGAAGGAGPREPRPGCSGPTNKTCLLHAHPGRFQGLLGVEVTDRFGVVGRGCEGVGVAGTQRSLEDVQQGFAVLTHLEVSGRERGFSCESFMNAGRLVRSPRCTPGSPARTDSGGGGWRSPAPASLREVLLHCRPYTRPPPLTGTGEPTRRITGISFFKTF